MNTEQSTGATGAAGMLMPIALLTFLLIAVAVIFSMFFYGSSSEETVIEIVAPGGGVEVLRDPGADNVTIEIIEE